MLIKQPTEHQEQVLFLSKLKYYYSRYPELMLIHATPNAAKRSVTGANYNKSEGLKPGVPDLNLPVARGEYGSLWIEMKKKKGGILSADQAFWINLLNASGNFAVVCKGAEEAEKILWAYMNEENGLEQYKVRYGIKKDKIGKKGGLSRMYVDLAFKFGWLV